MTEGKKWEIATYRAASKYTARKPSVTVANPSETPISAPSNLKKTSTNVLGRFAWGNRSNAILI